MIQPPPNPYHIPSTPIVVCDLDSTICDTRQRWSISPIDPKTGEWRYPPESPDALRAWEAYSMACYYDEPIPDNIALVKMLARNNAIAFASARSANAQDPTNAWLAEQGLARHKVFLRRPEEAFAGFKERKLNTIERQGFRIELILEDWKPNVIALRNLGYRVLHVVPPYGEEDLLYPTWAM